MWSKMSVSVNRLAPQSDGPFTTSTSIACVPAAAAPAGMVLPPPAPAPVAAATAALRGLTGEALPEGYINLVFLVFLSLGLGLQ